VLSYAFKYSIQSYLYELFGSTRVNIFALNFYLNILLSNISYIGLEGVTNNEFKKKT